MQIIETFSYTIPVFYLSAIFNGDVTGLSTAEEQYLDRFLEETKQDLKPYVDNGCSSCWVYADNFDEVTFFTYHHDVDGIKACDCVELEINLLR